MSGKTTEKVAWTSMKQRCANPKNTSYKNYGSRGIKICDEWAGRDGFAAFLCDMGLKPTSSHMLERIDNHKDYGPENCRWATRKEQNRNHRGNRLITYCGHTKPLVQWEEDLGMVTGILSARLCRGWSIERALSEPRNARMVHGKVDDAAKNKIRELSLRGIAQQAIAREVGCSQSTVSYHTIRMGL